MFLPSIAALRFIAWSPFSELMLLSSELHDFLPLRDVRGMAYGSRLQP